MRPHCAIIVIAVAGLLPESLRISYARSRGMVPRRRNISTRSGSAAPGSSRSMMWPFSRRIARRSWPETTFRTPVFPLSANIFSAADRPSVSRSPSSIRPCCSIVPPWLIQNYLHPHRFLPLVHYKNGHPKIARHVEAAATPSTNPNYCITHCQVFKRESRPNFNFSQPFLHEAVYRFIRVDSA